MPAIMELLPDAVESIRQLATILNGLRKSKDLSSTQAQVQINRSAELVNDALSKAINSQMTQLELTKKLEELQRKVHEFERWESEEKKYSLRCYSGQYVYQLKAELVNADRPNHYLCANCYDERKKSILQYRHGTIYVCHRCSNSVDGLPSPLGYSAM